MKPLAATVLGLCLAASSGAATFTVTNTADSGAGSLRRAITDANTAAGLDTIAFNVSGAGCAGSGVCTIAPTTQLPFFTSPVLIDGYTQPGSSPNTVAQGALNTILKIVLSGANIPGQYGLYITDTADGSTIRGLVVNGGFNYGIISFFSDGSTVRGCFVGVDAAGTTKLPNVWGVDAGISDTERRRFTGLDVLHELGWLDAMVGDLFGASGFWRGSRAVA